MELYVEVSISKFIYIFFSSVLVRLVCAFRYGREDLDVLGLAFRKDFCCITVQVSNFVRFVCLETRKFSRLNHLNFVTNFFIFMM